MQITLLGEAIEQLKAPKDDNKDTDIQHSLKPLIIAKLRHKIAMLQDLKLLWTAYDNGDFGNPLSEEAFHENVFLHVDIINKALLHEITIDGFIEVDPKVEVAFNTFKRHAAGVTAAVSDVVKRPRLMQRRPTPP